MVKSMVSCKFSNQSIDIAITFLRHYTCQVTEPVEPFLSFTNVTVYESNRACWTANMYLTELNQTDAILQISMLLWNVLKDDYTFLEAAID